MKKSAIHGFCVIVIMLTVTAFATADVRLPSVMGSHMVLQQGQPLPIWGWAGAGEKVTVLLDKQKKATAADANGNWKVVFPPMQADGKTHQITVSGLNTVVLEDVLIGEVWIGSGQSNMQWSLSGTYGAQKAIAAANLPKVRLFSVPLVQHAQPAKDVNASWKVCSPANVPGFSATLYYFGLKLHQDLKVPIGLIASSWGGSRIEPWTVKGKQSGGMYNGMIAPLQPVAMRGVVWYQGESNVNDGFDYLSKKKALISGWRKAWGREFPFYYVQIAPFAGYGAGRLPELWEAQAAALKIPRTGMIVATDLVDNLRDIHPRNKRDVGFRLARWALAKDYKKKEVVYSGPLYKRMKVEGSKIRLYFAHSRDGLASRDGKPLTEFQIAGKDGKFVSATAAIDGNTVVVSAKEVTDPIHVQFGWRNTANANLINKAGLPASPFRTRNWRGGIAKPSLIVSFPAIIKAGTPLNLTNIEYDTSNKIAQAKLHYRPRGAQKFTAASLAKTKTGFAGQIPAAATKTAFEFYLKLEVAGEGTVTYPEEGGKKPELLIPDSEPPKLDADPELVEAKSYRVALRWPKASDDLGVAGLRIYRANNKKGIVDSKPLAKLQPGQLEFVDKLPPAGKSVWYAVQPVDVAGRAGKPRSLLVNVPKDTAPKNGLKISATAGPKAIVVTWDGTLEADVERLLVFRSSSQKDKFQQVAEIKQPKSTGRWADVKVKSGANYSYLVKLADRGDNISNASAIALAKAGLYVRRINCGGKKIVDIDGIAWQADDGDSELGRWVTEQTINKAPKGLLAVYQSERWTNFGMQYTFDVQPGKYAVTLLLAETNDSFFGKGKRTFDVEINGKKYHKKVDVFSKVGANTAYQLRTDVSIGKGEQIGVILRAVSAGPALKGIEIKELR